MFKSAASLFYSFLISVVANYLITYVFRPPIIYYVLPMLPVALLRAKYLQKKCSRAWRYAHFGVMLAVSCLFYLLYRRLWALEILFVEILITLVLALWFVLCVEDKISLGKKNIGYLLLFAVVCALYFALVWTHYNRKAAAAIDYIVENNEPETGAAGEIDALCQEIDRVLLGGDNIYKFWDLADRYRRQEGSCEEEYRSLQETVTNPDRNKVHVLMNTIASPRE